MVQWIEVKVFRVGETRCPYSFSLDELREVATSAYRRGWESRSSLPPVDRAGCLYHYTSAEGLAGILNSRALWATDAAFLNDWSEIRYAADPLLKSMMTTIEEALPAYQSNSLDSATAERLHILGAARDVLESFTTNQEEVVRGNDRYIRGATFVSCLSTDHDQLGQWRGYGKGGYAIGFRREALVGAAPVFGPVKYGNEAIQELRKRVIQHFARIELPASSDRIFGPSGNEDTYSLIGYVEAVSFCLPLIALIKHRSFSEENEWRLVVPRFDLDYTKIAVRTVGGRLVPHVNCGFADDAIAEIVIGPGGDFHSERAVRALLAAEGYDPDAIPISHSSAPFRG